MEEGAVAYFEVRLAGEDPDETQDGIEIRVNEEFYLGRSPDICRRNWPDPKLSNKHLRIHCVQFSDPSMPALPPFVYATDVSTNGTVLKKRALDGHNAQHIVRLTRKDRSYLLDEGDELQISRSVTLVYRSLTHYTDLVFNRIQEQEKKESATLFASRYLITDRVLGVGGNGKVLAAIHQKTQRQLACKMIDLTYLHTEKRVENLEHCKRWPTNLRNRFREFDILRDLNHPNIINIEKVFWSSNNIYIFQELITGGDLFTFIEFKGGHLGDVETAVIIRQILMGVKYLHDHHIVHRDIKPDNILMTSLDYSARAIITDFGAARLLPDAERAKTRLSEISSRRMFSMVGTVEYVAPEVYHRNRQVPHSKGYSKSVDMWSIGITTANLLSGDHLFDGWNNPYEGDYRTAVLDLSSECNLSALDDPAHPRWSVVGARPKDFVKGLLVLQEDLRMTADEALAHPWFSHESYAAEFDALYKRAVNDWQPRRKVFKLAEPISDLIPDDDSDGAQAKLLSDAVVPKFFKPPKRIVPPHDIQQSLAASQIRRANTPLPTISDEYEEQQRASGISQPASNYSKQPQYKSFSLLPPPDQINDSMDSLTFDSELGGLMRINNQTEEYASVGPTLKKLPGKHLAELSDTPSWPSAMGDQFDQDTSQVIRDSDIVKETPVKNMKRRVSVVETPRTRLFHEQVSQDNASRRVGTSLLA